MLLFFSIEVIYQICQFRFIFIRQLSSAMLNHLPYYFFSYINCQRYITNRGLSVCALAQYFTDPLSKDGEAVKLSMRTGFYESSKWRSFEYVAHTNMDADVRLIFKLQRYLGLQYRYKILVQNRSAIIMPV